MIKRFLNLFKQDMLVAVRNYFHLVMVVLAIIMVIVVNFVIPEQVQLTPKEIFFDNTNNKIIESKMMENGVNKNSFVKSEDELYKELESNSNSLGIIAEGDLSNINFTIIGQGNEAEESFNLIDANLGYIINQLRNDNQFDQYRVERLQSQSKVVPFNKNMIPIFIFTEVILLGFLLIAVMVFQEKEEGGVRAYRVSPGGTLEYILSKVSVNIVLAILYTVILIVFTIGFNVNYVSLFITIILANIVMTLLGLSVSVFFKNLEEFIFVAIFIMTILGLAMMSYLTPSFTPDYIRILPSYPVLFGLREILFPTGKAGFITSLNYTLLIESSIMLLISFFLVRMKLMREGK